ncbi:DUF58 domain-containing protein [Methanofollis aquaemaris]|uniref:DUF58 domain-containing protein n=1 Tax=Methanofollis aquaemaris TaxID=126734 RepID=A0A8A3S446_9EURY|nr:DUF58 domain-containing protein [Methanofollis aquaemaris]QSZ66440.1 DUF58 domain-containing protein [Methanofollis aquaemaris]
MSVGSGAYGVLLYLGILAGLSLLVDSLAAVLGACAVGTFLFIRYAVAYRRFAMVVTSLKVTRELENPAVRQDSTVGVRVRVTAALPPGCRIEVEDLPPAGVQVVGGSTCLSLVGPLLEEEVISYSMVVPTEGEVVFRGVELRLPDLFFPRIAAFRGEGMRLPTLMVRPERRFITQKGEQDDTGPESRHPSGGTGGTVRSFREFVDGDDVRRIDWKVSAKRDSLHVRVYADEEERPPLIFVDLPRGEVSQHARAALKKAVRSAVAASVQTHGRTSLMAVKGPNLLVYLPLEADYARAMQALAGGENTTAEEAYFYRARPPSFLRTNLNALLYGSGNGNGDGNGHRAGSDYRERLSAVYGSTLRGRERTVYERQLTQAVWRLRPRRIELFSCRDGDRSHLDFVVCIAERAGVPVDLWKQNGHRHPESPEGGAEAVR